MNAPTPELSHDEIRQMLGVYALDAVDPDTVAIVERHLEGCLKCSTEVAQHHEVAGLLANSGGASPSHLWGVIADQLDGSTPPPWESLSARLETGLDRPDPTVRAAPAGSRHREFEHPPDGATVIPIDSDRRRGRWIAGAAVAVASAAAVVAVLLGVRVHRLDHQVNALQPPLSAAERSALDSPSSKRAQLVPPPGPAGRTPEVTVVLTRSGTGFVRAQQLSKLPTNLTYQLWGVVGGKTISLGLLGSRPTMAVFSVAGNVPVSAFAITAERAGGVVESANQPVVSGEVNA